MKGWGQVYAPYGGYGGKGSRMPVMHGPVENRVYVSNLPWHVAWQELKDHMKSVGEVVYADIFTEDTGRSRGCGLVAFRRAEDAQRAVLELNDSELSGRQIAVREDRVDQSTGERKDCRVYVGNLAWIATWKDLKDHFRSVGEVKRADILSEGNLEGARSKGAGIVEFSTKEEDLYPSDETRASAAVEQLTGTEILGRKIFVREDRESNRPQTLAWPPGDVWSRAMVAVAQGPGFRKSFAEPFTKVFAGNLPYSVTWQQLKDHMRQVGEVLHVEILMDDNDPRRSKGCGVVEFATFGAARRAVQYLHDSMLQGRLMYVREYHDDLKNAGGATATKDVKAGQKFRVKVGNVASGTRWQDLKDHLKSAGDVAHVAMLPGAGTGAATAAYTSEEAAIRAAATLDGSSFRNQVLSVEVIPSPVQVTASL
ncbi:putative RNA-binding protein [Symbiodinium microadriaticum]|uniref:Putative RNA-binding protein n=1 Tax=Symbiodinium microadriaticum TaxID=2951 RepID=A0A1Q9DEF6_SYMMI|nr:putative RNA-binding protein [Symbiodinium microadriaticum]